MEIILPAILLFGATGYVAEGRWRRYARPAHQAALWLPALGWHGYVCFWHAAHPAFLFASLCFAVGAAVFGFRVGRALVRIAAWRGALKSPRGNWPGLWWGLTPGASLMAVGALALLHLWLERLLIVSGE
uniref:Uncharacterized protein n=1 Tax=Candidatus Kentrum sp. UNK TaxID=2126344 RepID=A0A451AMG7_9GAMM|nr:MAG: hypothetical protein BECKUNK1418G_GA0071005_11322 [Candidatus Kentron sp. UNK]VFK72586.1 MAG: hypothetical protein BECKUNK1418H_GA0071006_11242 [Candidatus Kentron sp. UNK]